MSKPGKHYGIGYIDKLDIRSYTTMELRPECYGKDLFYDVVTRACSSCSDICDNANIQGTTQYCNEECPGYQSEITTSVVPTRHDVAVIPQWLIALLAVIMLSLIISGLIFGCYKLIKYYQPPVRDASWLCRLLFAISNMFGLRPRIVDNDDVPHGIPVVQEPEEIQRLNPIQHPHDDESRDELVPS